LGFRKFYAFPTFPLTHFSQVDSVSDVYKAAENEVQITVYLKFVIMIRIVAITVLLFGLACGEAESPASGNSTETEDSSEGRIVGGENADIRNFPYQASIQVKHRNGYFHTCGGSIVNPSTIVSAAHCFYP
jgi:Trypsin